MAGMICLQLDLKKMIIKYPIYIVSKGRWKNPITAKAFLSDNIPFKILVEPQEYERYCDNIGAEYIEKLPFANLGLGSYPPHETMPGSRVF